MNRNEWQTIYDEAGSVRAVAQQLGCTHSWVVRKLREFGIEPHVKRVGTRKPPPTPEEVAAWRGRYDEAGSISELARRMGVTDGTIRYHLKRHGIELRGSGFKSPKSIRHYGPDNSQWKGGTFYHSDGYVYEYAPDHPDAPKGKGYVLQHRLVMESKLGRPLAPGELVHHINEVKDDNRPENLELHDRSTHMKHHKSAAKRDAGGRFAT